MNDTIAKLDKQFCLRLPPGLIEAIRAAARKQRASPSAWARQVLALALERENVPLAGPALAADQLRRVA